MAEEKSDHVIVIMRHAPRLDDDSNAVWSDKSTRPYDTPISDFQLPLSQLDLLKPYNITVVVSSPFRRCLQTAGVICRALRLSSLVIDYGLSEVMHTVRSTKATNVNFLNSEGILEAVGDSVEIADVRGSPPSFNEEIGDSLTRYHNTIKQIEADYPLSSVLCITHGNAVEVCGSHYVSPPVIPFEVNYCGFIAVRDHKVVGFNGMSLVDEVDSL